MDCQIGDAVLASTLEHAKAEIARMDAAMNDPKSPAMDRLRPEHAVWMRRREQLFSVAYPG